MIITSCETSEYYFFNIKNDSSKSVSYTFNKTYNDKLEPSESKDYQIKCKLQRDRAKCPAKNDPLAQSRMIHNSGMRSTPENSINC